MAWNHFHFHVHHPLSHHTQGLISPLHLVGFRIPICFLLGILVISNCSFSTFPIHHLFKGTPKNEWGFSLFHKLCSSQVSIFQTRCIRLMANNESSRFRSLLIFKIFKVAPILKSGSRLHFSGMIWNVVEIGRQSQFLVGMKLWEWICLSCVLLKVLAHMQA